MQFWEAMREVAEGNRVRRDDWNRVGHVRIQFADFDNDGIPYRVSVMSMVMKSGNVGPYTPSNCDMTADDWSLV